MRMPTQFGSQQMLGQFVSALAARGAAPSPRHPASIETATTSFTRFLRMAAPFKSDRLPWTRGLQKVERELPGLPRLRLKKSRFGPHESQKHARAPHPVLIASVLGGKTRFRIRRRVDSSRAASCPMPPTLRMASCEIQLASTDGCPAVQYNPPSGDFHLDILTRLGEAFQFEDLEAERIDLDGLRVSVASPRTLYRMKRNTVRPKDWGDAEALRRRFRLEED